ncbi:polysaccharide pyruvyl transferase family protein [Weissella soli]|uniref:polysaccharide pyruvyl transferase family protein n=1 Tax=Weissella soli TaxID=155866 RepID=UPI001F1A1A64|nr:polysaccharide pyruvyl transferase family protein [Weissella soli]GJM47741.1 hypothetical protein WSSLDB02_02980 [Weissella soli]
MFLIKTINDDANFGNRLQNYALQRVLSEQFGVTKTLQDSYNWKWNYYYGVINLINSFHIVAIKTMLSNHQNYTKQLAEARRHKLFRNFTINYVEKVRSLKRVSSSDIFVIGSDQIWNPYFRNNIDDDFLPKYGDNRVISYAASFGISDISDEDKRVIQHGLRNIDCISVREYSAKKIIEKMTSKPVQVVLDPTMLITNKQWEVLIKQSQFNIKEPFLVTYFLGDLSEEYEDYIQKVALKENLKIVRINDVNQPYYSKVGPIEFVSLIANAEIVLADSYHAAVFSIIFNVNFELFNRNTNMKNMNTRMKTLFKTFELENRLHTDVLTPMKKIDFSEINSRLATERAQSLNWLEKSIKDS